MSFENLRKAEEHAGDAFFLKMGLPEQFGLGEITFHGRTIQRRDYFFQEDVSPGAKQAFQILSAMDETDPRFPMLRDGFMASAQQYLGEN